MNGIKWSEHSFSLFPAFLLILSSDEPHLLISRIVPIRLIVVPSWASERCEDGQAPFSVWPGTGFLIDKYSSVSILDNLFLSLSSETFLIFVPGSGLLFTRETLGRTQPNVANQPIRWEWSLSDICLLICLLRFVMSSDIRILNSHKSSRSRQYLVLIPCEIILSAHFDPSDKCNAVHSKLPPRTP